MSKWRNQGPEANTKAKMDCHVPQKKNYCYLVQVQDATRIKEGSELRLYLS